MATKELRVCDVYGTARGVERIHIEITVPGELLDEVIVSRSVDLSPRAVKRLLRMLNKGVSPTRETLGDGGVVPDIQPQGV